MDFLQLIENLKDPALVQSMPMGDKLIAGLMVTIMGMTITFIGLMFLWGFIALMSMMLGKTTQGQVSEISQKPVTQPIQQPAPSIAVETENDEELVAVITAAIAASLKTSVHNIVVTNIVRVPDETPAWARSGRIEQMNARF